MRMPSSGSSLLALTTNQTEEQINLDELKLENSVFRGWNESLSGVYSWSFRALSAYEKNDRIMCLNWSNTVICHDTLRATKWYSLFDFL